MPQPASSRASCAGRSRSSCHSRLNAFPIGRSLCLCQLHRCLEAPRQDPCARLRPPTWAGHCGDRVAFDRCAAFRAHHLRLEAMPANLVNEQNRAALAGACPSVSPCGQRQYGRHQIAPRLGQSVFVARRPALVGIAFDHAVLHQRCEPPRREPRSHPALCGPSISPATLASRTSFSTFPIRRPSIALANGWRTVKQSTSPDHARAKPPGSILSPGRS